MLKEPSLSVATNGVEASTVPSSVVTRITAPTIGSPLCASTTAPWSVIVLALGCASCSEGGGALSGATAGGALSAAGVSGEPNNEATVSLVCS